MKTKTIDLTRIINEKLTTYPGTPPPKLDVMYTVDQDGFSEYMLTMVSHTGTHIDAPCHILKNTKSIDLFPVEKFTGRAIVIPCQDQKDISLEFLKPFEEKIAEADFVLFFTGWQYKWNSAGYFENCPTPTPEAAKWLSDFNLKGIGIDALSTDKIGTAEKVTPENLPNHYIFLEKEILLIENLTNLDQLPDTPFTFHCLPLYLEKVDGSPVRAIAIINEQQIGKL
jgi:kynurenine formamidase